MTNHSINLKQYLTRGGLLALLLALTALLAWPLAAPSHAQEPPTPDGDIGIAAFPGGNGKIVFASNRDGNDEIYVMNADGTGQTRLTNNTVRDRHPIWSADGAKISFIRDDQHIYYMNADGTGETLVFSTQGIAGGGAHWSPDGTKLAFNAIGTTFKFDIYTVNIDGTNQTNLTNDDASDFAPAWSPDGAKIVFRKEENFYVMNAADGTGVTQLTSSGQHGAANWSPDGSKLTYSSDQNGGGAIIGDIWVMNADGSNKTQLTNSPAIEDGVPAWSPDGSKIVFESNRDGNYEIYVMNADGSNPTNLTNNGADDYHPDWQPLQAGTIRIVNAASPADNTVFNFTDNIAAPNSFTLQNPGTITKTFAIVPVGTYTVTEQALSNWVLQDLTCDDANSSGNKTTGVATINLEVGETVTCTFTNIENNTIIVNKFAVGGDGTFPFTSTVPGYTNFNMTTTAGFTATLLSGVTAGTYAISETVPSGWNLYEADPQCSNGDPASAISLAAGEVAICNFINLAEDSITVKKQTIGGDGAFDFTSDIPAHATFTLTTTSQSAEQTFTGLTPGSTYGITETVPTGWAQTGATCDNGDSPGSISLGAGEHITCVITNTKQAQLTVVKLTDGEDGSFDFTSTIPGHTAFTLTTSNGSVVTDFLSIPPGTYSLTQTVQLGWAQAWFTCDDGSAPSAITLAAGEDVTCSFASDRAVYYFPIIFKNGTP